MKIKSINPATGKVLASYSLLSEGQAVRELKKLDSNSNKWKNTGISDRLKKVRKIKDILKSGRERYAKLMTLEMGKPIKQSRSEIDKCIKAVDYYVKNGKKFLEKEVVKTEHHASYVRYDPLGLILGIKPWNYPFWLPLRSIIPALCAGNVYAMKHSNAVPGCSVAIDEIMKKAGLGSYYKSLIIDGKTASKLIENPRVKALSFTGGTEVGKRIGEVAGKNLKKPVLELGGSNPFIVLDDADVAFSCKIALNSRMTNCGQSCNAAKRFIVTRKVAKEFVKKLISFFGALKMGDPLDEEMDGGPLASAESLKTIEAQVRDAVKKGAKVLVGGKRMKKPGFFYEPTILTNVKHNMSVLKDEVFGPIASVIVVNSEKDAIMEANNSRYGLGASLWTRDLKKAEKLVAEIESGNVSVNKRVSSDLRLPSGGIKESGFGRELYYYGIREFCNIKSVIVDKI